MAAMVSIAIGKKKIIPVFNIYQTPVWYFVAYTVQDNILPFMVKSNVYTEYEIVSRVIIDNIPYNTVQDLSQCRATEKTWVQIGALVYVHFADSYTVWAFHLFQEILKGFSNEYTYISSGLLFNTGFLKYIPKIREESDDMEYSTMKFKSESIELINKKGMFDDTYTYLGTDIFVYIDKVLEYKLYVKNIKIKLESVIFECGDIRERFQTLVPDKKFDKEKFPYIKDDYKDQYMQEVFGYCEWVPCVCIDELDILNDDDTKKQTRTFRVAGNITSLDHVMVKMTQPEEKGGGEVFTSQSPQKIDGNNGTFTLNINQCMPLIWMGEDVPEIFEVYASGTFVNKKTPLDIIKYLLEKYENILYTDLNFNRTQIEQELGGIIEPIGMVIDTPTRIFDIISRLQTVCSNDFQFFVSKDKFSAKRDDNARVAAYTIRMNDILNIHDVEIDMNNDLYATVVDIGYNMNYRTNKLAHYINERYKYEIKNLNNYDKIYENDTSMYSESAAINKSNLLIEFFRNIHPTINNIQIKAIKTLQLYDVVNIDLRVLVEDRSNISIFAGVLNTGFSTYDHLGGEAFAVSPAWKEEKKYRNFGGVIKGKVMSIEHDIVMGIMTIGVTKL